VRTTTERDDELARKLLAPLDRVEPVRLVSGDRGRRRRRSAALAVALAVAAGGLAAAAVSGPLDGVFSADHPRVAGDALDPATGAMLRRHVRRHPSAGRPLLQQSRLLGALPTGRRVYLVPTSTGRLCLVVERLAESCGNPLTQAAPLTFAVADADRAGGGEGPIAYGVARDGVVSVSFTIDGRRVTVPVRRNLFAFQASPGARRFSAPVAHFTNGTSRTLR
jgi:hypothetical protein